jgi:hypothetical protein
MPALLFLNAVRTNIKIAQTTKGSCYLCCIANITKFVVLSSKISGLKWMTKGTSTEAKP